MQNQIDFTSVAEIYDSYVRTESDIPFWLKEAQKVNGKVLELTAGTGRVSIPLLRAGVDLTCVDRSPGMLAVLKRKIQSACLTCSVVEMDIADLSLPLQYDLIFIPFNSFSEIIDRKREYRVLNRIKAHLAEEGEFICTLHNPKIRSADLDGNPRLLGNFPIPDGIVTVTYRFHTRGDSGIVQGTQFYELRDKEGKLAGEQSMKVNFRLFEPEEFENLVKQTGFRVVDLYGNYDYSKFDRDVSPYMIWRLKATGTAKDESGMKDKTCMVTGANSGIGKVTAMELAKMGAKVVMVCRNREKGEEAKSEIVSSTGNSSVHLITGDLSSQREIRKVAAEFRERFDSLHVLVNNAGGLVPTRQLTEDGLEKTFATNHLGYFILTNLLLDMLVKSAPSRIVNVASAVHRFVKLDFDDLQGERRYRQFQAYSLSKLENVLFTYELAHRLDGNGVTVNCMEPGAVYSNFYNKSGFRLKFFSSLFGWTMRSSEKGAETVVYLAASPEVEGITGKYFKDKKAIPSSKLSTDPGISRRLWEISESLVKMK